MTKVNRSSTLKSLHRVWVKGAARVFVSRYLPESVLLDDESESELDAKVPPPGVGEGCGKSVCIAFTDIQGSTQLWEDSLLNMADVLATHDSVIRDAGRANNGYEVKTIGDAFMFAFATPAEGCRFALDAQLQLARQKWPQRLLEHSNAARGEEEGAVVWNGVRIRIGMHYGEVNSVQNPTTKRYDYYGGVVNTAARVEAALRFGGLVGVTQPMMDAIGKCDAHTVDLGFKELKGLSAPVKILVLLPPPLASRERVITAAQPPPHAPPPPTASDPPSDSDSSLSSRPSVSSHSHSQRHSRLSASQNSRGAGRGGIRRVGTASRLLCTLSSGAASVAVTQCKPWGVPEEALHRFLAAQVRSAKCTEGVLLSVVSTYVIVTWNTSRQCAGHAMRCASYLMMDPRVSAAHGATSGLLLFGNMSASKSRFANVVGGWVELAWRLCDEASSIGDYGLVTPTVSMWCSDACRPHRAQVWRHVGSYELMDTVVWSLSLPLDETDQRLCILCDPRPDNEASDQAFRKAVTEDDWGEFEQLPELPETELTKNRQRVPLRVIATRNGDQHSAVTPRADAPY
eukprot:Hpha_TRINITY_DN16633_c0_g2::TRINITY_DN16633_c0_g2_i3::g.179458::m.179458